MKNTANIVIIGGGIIGASIAFFLSKAGVKDIIIIEKEELLGAASTGLCAGGIRQQFGTEINTRLCMESVKIFENFKEIAGENIEFIQAGYLFILSKGETFNHFKNNVAMQKSLGLDVHILSPSEIKEKIPFAETADLLGGTFCQSDGFADPNEVTQAFAAAARKNGVSIYNKTEAREIKLSGENKIKSVVTNQGEIETPVIVNAAGAWSNLIAKMVNIDLPVLPYRRQLFITEPFKEIPEVIPMIVDFDNGLYIRKESGGVLMGKADLNDPPGINLHVDWDFMTTVVELALNRIPVLEKSNIMRGWAGLYEITPDHHAILGKTPQVEGFILANGFSGHGFMQAPAVGKIIQQIITGEKTDIDVSELRYERFKEGKLINEAQVF
ncbi:MAG: FAD-binding oxidoreductase [Armatimonadota bacterium]